ncbi:hypothetical protein WOC76_14330 [Methylocystis sp. IM3]|jgi:hypothetical protein|uniref:hypothetical protein n=1 Tax=unclassified Methylocystis TaxID=2625913 RepID=UPI000FBE5FA7|nr:MAG: hypothetical protein EKK29_01510 [Hyphomicrobiales bacterium]
MRYWLVPILVCAGSAPSHALDLIYNYSTPFVSVTTGVQTGQNNTLTTQQNGPVNIYVVQQLALGKPSDKLSNDATVYQAGKVDIVNLGQHIMTSPVKPLAPLSFSQP